MTARQEQKGELHCTTIGIRRHARNNPQNSNLSHPGVSSSSVIRPTNLPS